MTTLNPGDKIFCIKNSYSSNNNALVHKSNQIYEVYDLQIRTDKNTIDIYVSCEKNVTKHDYYGYTLEGELIANWELFSDHFITNIKELRKIKIKKLNEFK